MSSDEDMDDNSKKSAKRLLLSSYKKSEVKNTSSASSNDSLNLVVDIGDDPLFEREFINFNTCVKKIDYDDPAVFDTVQNIQNQINETASKMIFKWKTVPVSFPSSIIENALFNNDKLFKFPTFDELDELATDDKGRNKRLIKSQLESIKKEGKFEVNSSHFPGKTHKWELAHFLQKGYMNINKTFFNDLSKALYLLVITAKNRFFSKNFSILEGVKSWSKGLIDLLDMFIGIPKMTVVPYDQKLRNEQKKFLIIDLKVDTSEQEKFNVICEKINRALVDKSFKLEFKEFNDIPYLYRTPDNLLIDLRLYDKVIRKLIEPMLERIIRVENKEKLLLETIRSESITLFKNEGFDDNDIVSKTKNILKKEYNRMLITKLLNDAELENLSPGIGKVLADHLRSIIIMQEVYEKFEQNLKEHLEKYVDALKKKYKIKSLLGKWVSDCVKEENEKYVNENKYYVHEKSIERCQEEKLFQTAYFIQRELTFLRQIKDNLIKDYEKIKTPINNYAFKRNIWFPKNYIIEKNEYNKKTTYSLRKYVTYKNSSSYPFWRWTNFFLRTWVYFCNMFFLFGIVIPFASPVSFRALFSINPYYPDKTVNQNTGKLEKNLNFKVKTFISRLTAIWDHVNSSRRRFESVPDKGLIGKTVQRVFNRIWNYIFKGFIGSIGLTLIYPSICIFASVGSIFLGLTSPIWYPILSLLMHVSFLLIFDWDYCVERSVRTGLLKFLRLFRTIFIRLGVLGILQPIAALLTATVVCPVSSLAVTLFGVTRMILRKSWDNFMYYLILKRNARVPSRDTFFARRIAGPGLASNYFYQITPEQGLAALEIHLEIKIISSYLSFIEEKLNEPIRGYTKFFDPIFNPYSYSLHSTTDSNYKEISESVEKNLKLYRDQANKRLEKLRRKTPYNYLGKIRLVEKDLDILVAEATKLVENNYVNLILKYQKKSPKNLFNEKGLEDGDWSKYTEIVLEEIFGTGFATPLEQTDCVFSLEVDHLNLEKYAQMISSSKLRDDLDLVTTHYKPRRTHIVVNMPGENVAVFDPNLDYTNIYFDNLYLKDTEISIKFDRNMNIPVKIVENNSVTAAHIYNKQNNENKIDIAKLESLI